ncbi:MAG: UDP-3-O-(3-hydroxymyristoyl)glucosamine N-acyltransferase [Rhizobiales bacterium]|nr:UDP-3-O-(3-hydroxymyristoyl)glucosamine N-acyltransferase [Hyphomicrobiales bacterium]
MNRQTFFECQGPINLTALAQKTGATLAEADDPSLSICDVASLSECGPNEVTFLIDRKRLDSASGLNAGACYIAPEFAERLPQQTVALLTPTPELAFALAVSEFYPDALRNGSRTGSTLNGVVEDDARLEPNVEIEAGAVIGARAEIGSGTVIGANAVICADVKIGRNCTIAPCSTVMHALIGDNVIIHSGARIGQDGFGYVQTADGFVKIPQIGRVIIHNNVEIGANATIDRGSLTDTIVGEGSKVDNLVHIGHNVSLGRSCVVVGQAGISGSASVGDGVLIGGQAGINPHVEIGTGAQVGPQAGLTKSIPAGARVMGSPAIPLGQYLREVLTLTQLARKGRKDKGVVS